MHRYTGTCTHEFIDKSYIDNPYQYTFLNKAEE